MITQFQSGHDFVLMATAGSQVDDTGDFILGRQSLKLNTNGEGSPTFTRMTYMTPPIDLTEKSLKVLLKVTDIDMIKELRVTVTADKFQTFRNYWIVNATGGISTSLGDNEWAAIEIGPENIRDFGNPDVSKIDTIQLRIVDKSDGPVSVWFNGLAFVDSDN
jgi:hypothetical protein